jgi:hypothetical protein
MAAVIGACQSSADGPTVADGNGSRGSPCAIGVDCRSGVCTNNTCVGNGIGAPAGSACSSGDNCASDLCVNGKCAAGSNLLSGSSCASASECAAGACIDGVCGESPEGDAGDGGTVGEATGEGGASQPETSGGQESSTGGALTGGGGLPVPTPAARPLWPGAGDSFAALTLGCGPETASSCGGDCELSGGDPSAELISPPVMHCFAHEEDPTPDDPAATIEELSETLDGQSYVHIRVTFDPALTDLSYGEGACCGWQEIDRDHKFDELRGGDHTELALSNGDGVIVLIIRIDLISPDAAFPCGFGTKGVSGEEGKVVLGDAAWVLGAATSISRNLNGCGYCSREACAPSGDCKRDSPATDDAYTPNPLTPNWDYRQVYEVWIAAAAFSASGYGRTEITYNESSPSKIDENELLFAAATCPPEWTSP